MSIVEYICERVVWGRIGLIGVSLEQELLNISINSLSRECVWTGRSYSANHDECRLAALVESDNRSI